MNAQQFKLINNKNEFEIKNVFRSFCPTFQIRRKEQRALASTSEVLFSPVYHSCQEMAFASESCSAPKDSNGLFFNYFHSPCLTTGAWHTEAVNISCLRFVLKSIKVNFIWILRISSQNTNPRNPCNDPFQLKKRPAAKNGKRRRTQCCWEIRQRCLQCGRRSDYMVPK